MTATMTIIATAIGLTTVTVTVEGRLFVALFRNVATGGLVLAELAMTVRCMLVFGVALVFGRRACVANLVPLRCVLAVVLLLVLVRALGVLMPVLSTTEARRAVLDGVLLLLCLRLGGMSVLALALAVITAVRSVSAVDVLVLTFVAVLALAIPVVQAERNALLALGHLGLARFAPPGDLVAVLAGLRISIRLLRLIVVCCMSIRVVLARRANRMALAFARFNENLGRPCQTLLG